ncbi:MAG: hypothetical protein V4436_00765 [Patescibacteria group bacterium]
MSDRSLRGKAVWAGPPGWTIEEGKMHQIIRLNLAPGQKTKFIPVASVAASLTPHQLAHLG